MSNLGAPPPDWGSIFDRAHRRVGRRLLLLGGIGAAGALLLLSSGLTANGSIKWNLGSKNEPKKHAAQQKAQQKQQGKHGPPQHQHSAPSHRHHKASNGGNGEPAIGGHPKKPRCASETGDSSGKQYEDCPPQAVEEEEEEEEERTGEEAKDQSSLAGAAPTGASGP